MNRDTVYRVIYSVNKLTLPTGHATVNGQKTLIFIL